jgi:uncharacterized membrane-anchored protein
MAWWKTAKPGDKVVAIDDFIFIERPLDPPELFKGDVVTIEYIRPSQHIVCGFIVKAVGYQYQYAASCFRPLEKRSTETGMRMIKSKLTSNKQPEMA